MPTFIVPQARKGVTWWPRRSHWVVEEGPVHLQLEPSIARRENNLRGDMIHGITIPCLFNGKLHLSKRATMGKKNKLHMSQDCGDFTQQAQQHELYCCQSSIIIKTDD